MLWKGKPAAGRLVYIRGPQQFRKNIRTDESGRLRIVPEARGEYTLRTSVEEATPSEEGGERYELVRHNATMIMVLPIEK